MRGQDHFVALVVGQVAFAGQQAARGVRAGVRRDLGQAFQQQVDQVAAPEAAERRTLGVRRHGQGRRRGGAPGSLGL
jgi:hypothetical protein